MTDLITVFCGSCGTRGDVASNQVTAALRCRCGSADLGLAGIDDKPQDGLTTEALAKVAGSFDDSHVTRYIGWAQQQGYDPNHVKTLKRYENEPGVGRAHTNFLADQLYVGGGEDNWRQEGHRDAALRTAMPKGPGTGWTGPDPRRLEGWNEYVGPESQSVPRSAPVAMSQTCPVCHGSKYDLLDKGPCRECGGTGTVTHPTDRPSVQSYDSNRPMPPGGAGWVGASLQGGLSAVAVAKLGGRPSQDPYGSVDEVLMASSPEYAHRNQTVEQPFDPRNEKSFYPSADTLGPGVRTRRDHPYSHDPGQRPVPGYSPGLGYTENRPYQMDQAACPNCAHAPTELRKDNREDAWWHCPNCGPLANIDRNPQINPYNPPQGFRPDREMKTGGFLPRRKTGRLIAMLVKISQANTGLGASETLDVARATLQRYPEGR